MQALSRQIEQHHDASALRMSVHERIGPLRLNVWTRALFLPQYVADRILQPQRAVMRMIDCRMTARKFARERAEFVDMVRPGNLARMPVETVRGFCLEPCQLDKDPVGNARFETCAIG